MRALILTTLAASLCTAHAAHHTDFQTSNLAKFSNVCFRSVTLNVDFLEAQSLILQNRELRNDVFALMKTKLTAYRIPFDPKPVCGSPAAFITTHAIAGDPVDGVYSIANGLTLDVYGLPGGLSDVRIWSDDHVLGINSAGRVHDQLLDNFSKYLDHFAADWAVSHP